MQPISAGDRNKAAILLVLVVLVFGFLFWRVLGANSPANGGASPNVTVLSPTPSVGSANSAAPAENLRVVEIVPPPNALAVNPFRSVIDDNGGSAPSSRDSSGGNSVGFGTEISGAIGGSGPVLPSVGTEVPTLEPAFIGMISGEPPIGIFRVGSEEVIVKVGDKMPDGAVLTSIHGERAVISKKDRKFTLSLEPPR